MNYRPEIDGLRAMAVLPVILFHAGFEWFSGGFVGVDVFFVISGYLITTIILSEMAEGTFSIALFYERRARRILPALIIVMLVCLPCAYFLMLPDPLENFGQSLVSTTLFSNNILLYLTSGYWDLSSELKPLLHTWSLAVEEQYYLIFPLLILFLWRFPTSSIRSTLFTIALLSFSTAVLSTDADLTFFSLHTRAFEILAGALICPYLTKNTFHTRHLLNNLMSFLGAALVILSVVFFDESTPFPSAYTLAPVIGTCLLIHFTNTKTLIYKVLSNRFTVHVGLISYSAYLFHQPVLSFLKIYSKSEPSHFLMTLAICSTFILANLSHKYVEAPFRDRTTVSRKKLVTIIAGASIATLCIGLYLNMSNGLNQRLYEPYNPLEKSRNLSQRAWKYKTGAYEDLEKFNILVIGNSFGRDIVNVFLETYDASKFNLVYSDELADCSLTDGSNEDLINQSNLILFASNYASRECIGRIIQRRSSELDIYFIGSKQFGYNLNWILRINKNDRALLRNSLLPQSLATEDYTKSLVPAEHYISLVEPLSKNNEIAITDELGNLISDDRAHLTLSGVRFVGREVFLNSPISKLLDM